MITFTKRNVDLMQEILSKLELVDFIWNYFVYDTDDDKYKVMRVSSNFGNRLFLEADSLEELDAKLNEYLKDRNEIKDDLEDRCRQLYGLGSDIKIELKRPNSTINSPQTFIAIIEGQK